MGGFLFYLIVDLASLSVFVNWEREREREVNVLVDVNGRLRNYTITVLVL